MNNYGKAAIEAVKMCQQGQFSDPVTAWKMAVLSHVSTLEGQKKGCPKSAFLGLCEEGVVVGIPRGNYTKGKLNKEYALRALKLLQQPRSLADNPRKLWDQVMEGELKKPNSQMDVVVALWNEKLLAKV